MDPAALERELLRLSPEERKRIIDRVSVRDVLRGPSKSDPDVDLVYSAVERFLLSRGTKLPPLPILRTMRIDGPQLRKAAPEVVRILREDFKCTKTLEEHRVLDLLLDSVRRRLRRKELPIKLRTILQQLADLNTVIDEAFPGYREAGMLPFLRERMVRG